MFEAQTRARVCAYACDFGRVYLSLPVYMCVCVCVWLCRAVVVHRSLGLDRESCMTALQQQMPEMRRQMSSWHQQHYLSALSAECVEKGQGRRAHTNSLHIHTLTLLQFSAFVYKTAQLFSLKLLYRLTSKSHFTESVHSEASCIWSDSTRLFVNIS